MSDLTSLNVSFFKNMKIDYHFNKVDKIIIFPCYACSGSALMRAVSGSWKCQHCETTGGLKHLIEATKQFELKRKLINPHKEIIQIDSELKRLEEKFGSEFVFIRKSVQDLFDFLMLCKQKK